MNLDDIVIKQDWDETINQRIMIIYGNTLNDGVNKNGQMDIISNTRPISYYHATYLQKHAETNYTTDKLYQKVIEKSKHTYNEAVSVMIQANYYQNIIFTDTTQDNSKQKYGVFYFPNTSPSLEQYKSLKKLISKLHGYQEILINGKIYVTENNLLDCKIKFIYKGNEIDSLIETMQGHYKIKKKKRL